MKPSEKQALILIVDDTPSNITVLGETLGSSYDVHFALNGIEAVEQAKRVPQPDIILLDVMMPDMDGYEVCRRLKADPATSRIPVIFITAKTAWDDEGMGFAAGGTDYITKPFHTDLVLARVKPHIVLKQNMDNLEALIEAKTSEVLKANEQLKQENKKVRQARKKLEVRTNELQEANVALKVLLKKIEENRQELEANMLENLKSLVLPCLEKARKNVENRQVSSHLDYMESCLKDLFSPFAKKLNMGYHGFTPAEMEVATMIKYGRSTKEIADMLNISEKTVGFHRSSIRGKLAIKNKPVNLKAFLMSLE